LVDKSSLAELSDDEWLKRENNASSRLCNQLERVIQKNKKITSSTIKIQSIQRGRKARHVHKVKQQETQAAIKIQTIHRGRSVRSKQLREKNKILEKQKSISLRKARRTGSLQFAKQDIEAVEERKRQAENYAAVKLQALHRGRSARKQTHKRKTGHNQFKENKRMQPNLQKQRSVRLLSPHEMRMKKIAAEEKRIQEDSKKYQYDPIAGNTEQLQKHDNTRDEAAIKLQALHRGRETRKKMPKNKKKQDTSGKNTTTLVETSMKKEEWSLSPRTMEDKLEALFQFLQQHDQNNSINHNVPVSIPRSKFMQLIEENQSELDMYLEDETFLKAFILGTKLPSALTCKYKSMQINVTPKIINELLTIEQASAPTLEMSSEHSNHSAIHTIDHDDTRDKYKKQSKKKKKKKRDKKSKKSKKHKKDKKGKRKRKSKDDEADPDTTADEIIENHDAITDSVVNDRDDEQINNLNIRNSNNDTLEVKVDEKHDVSNITNENLEDEKQVNKDSEKNNNDDLLDLEAELALLEALNDTNKDEHRALEAELETKLVSIPNTETAIDGAVENINEEIIVNDDVLQNTGNGYIGIESHPDFDHFMVELSKFEDSINDAYAKTITSSKNESDPPNT
jgi:hypothetical protein